MSKTFLILASVFLLAIMPLLVGESQNTAKIIIVGDRQSQPAALPGDYTMDLTKVPQPILDSHPEWITLYNKAWELAKKMSRRGTAANGLITVWIDEAMSTHKIWQWDTCFGTIFGKYSNGEFPSVEALENFYRKQHSNGYICREISEDDGSDVSYIVYGVNSFPNPPLYAYAEWEYYLLTGDSSHFTKMITANQSDTSSKTVLRRLVDYYNWCKSNVRQSDGYYVTDYYGNGMDDSPRNAIGNNGAWLCLTSQQAMAAYYIAQIAGVAGDSSTQTAMMNEYNINKNLVNNGMWSAGDNFYFDLDASRNLYKVKTIASFWPMFCKIASQSQADGLITHLKNSSEFWRPNMVPTLAADEPQYRYPTGEYWCGAIWAPTSYMVVRGLEDYGYHDLAKTVADNYVGMLSRVLTSKGTIYENNAPEIDGPSLDSMPDFVGWSGLGPIAMLIENVLGFRINAPANTINWDLKESARNGIQNLRYKSGTITSMVCAARSNPNSNASITINTDIPFTLTVSIGGQQSSQAIATGQHTYAFNGSSTNILPVPVINGPYRGMLNQPVQFSSAGSNDPDGTIASYLWSFGDGATSTQANPIHTYTVNGVYNVSLSLTDNQGASCLVPAQTTTAITNTGMCAARGNSTSYSYIKKVQFGTINNPSSSQGYQDFTNMSTTVQKGNTYQLQVTMGAGSAGADRERLRVWIDLNRDIDFDEQGEFVLDQENITLSENGVISGNITVPSSASSGNMVMRILLAYYNSNENPGPCGYFDSGEVEDYSINIGGSPVALSIVSQPLNATVSAGSSATFSVTASGGTTPYRYQWYRNGTSISGATITSYTLTTQSSDNGAKFKVTVTDSASPSASVTSNEATLTVNTITAPSITTQPVNKTVSVGQTAAFSVVASGTAPLSYQWYKNSTAVSGATAANYTTPAATTADNGTTFYVKVSNSAGSINSNTVTLTVTSGGGGALTNGVAVAISGAAASLTNYYIDVPSGSTNLVIATSGGTGDLDLYTKFGSAPTTSSYDCRPYASGNNETCTVASPSAGRYYIMLYGYSAYSGASLKASFSTSSGVPVITTQPVNKTVAVGGTTTFSVVAGNATSYQWYKRSVAISGATAANYTTPAATTADNGATFYVRVSNSTGSVNSNTVTLTVGSSGAPTINLQVTVAVGSATCNPNTTNTVKVVYWVDSQAAVTKTTSPFTYVINTTSMTKGSTHNVYARASNSAGQYVDSGWKSFVVQ